MISKLIAWGKDRHQAMRRIIRALMEYEISGIQTNIPFLIRILNHPDFISGHLSTHFIERYHQDLIGENGQLAEAAGIAAAIQFVESDRNIPKPAVTDIPCADRWKMIRRRQNMGPA
jgi:3-methylcrotonyl-CoA carboxylase alpha subunit